MSMRIAFAVLRFIANSRFEAYSRALNPHPALSTWACGRGGRPNPRASLR